MSTIYGYTRISRPQQSIERQIRNIKEAYPDAIIVQEAYTGTRMDRPEWNRLISKVRSGDAIVFDSVSRMSRDAESGFQTYKELLEDGITLSFLKEPYLNTDVFLENCKSSIEMTGDDIDIVLEAINKYMFKLAEKQIYIAFEQAQKEVDDLRKRTSEGIRTAQLNGKQIGAVPGKKLTTKKSIKMKAEIKRLSKEFNGYLNDVDCIKLTGLSKNTYYKYKRELKNDLEE